MLDLVSTALIFILPASCANAAASVTSVIKPLSDWNYPLDFYQTFRGKRIFGQHKTIRGLVVGIIFALIVGYLEHLFLNKHPNPFLGSYSSPSFTLLLSFFLGLGAILGDALKSFFKRQYDISPGSPWLPFDWIDYLFGAIIFSYPLLPLPTSIYVTLLIIVPVISALSNIFSGLLKIKPGYI